MGQSKHVLPTILAFWLVLASLNVFFRTQMGMADVSSYLIFLVQVIFDIVAVYFIYKLASGMEGAQKMAAMLFVIGLAALTLSDFFFHASNTVHWFNMGNGDMFVRITLLLFFLFMALGFLKTSSIHRENSSASSLSYLWIVLSALIILALYFMPEMKDSSLTANLWLSLSMIFSVLMLVFALIAMTRVQSTSFNYFALGAVSIFLSSVLMSMHGVESSRGLESLWMLGSILLATGAYLRVNEA